MNIRDLYQLETAPAEMFELTIDEKISVNVYPGSVIRRDQHLFFMARSSEGKYLYILSKNESNESLHEFLITRETEQDNYKIKKCPLNHGNVQAVQKMFSYTRPELIGLQKSFGFGDRLGLANPGHLKAVVESQLKPVLAQQSIRELIRTRRQPEEVMDAAVWAIMQEGYQGGFGADADHLKSMDDIDRMVKAGYTMFTIDPGDLVNNQADQMEEAELSGEVQKLDWRILGESVENTENRYIGSTFQISADMSLKPGKQELHRALAKYGKALAHIKIMSDHLKSNYPDYPSEIEVSVDETESVTTPFEHFFIASELKRMGVEFISLAPRFIGRFEKGIDYRGDLDIFRREYEKHLQICRYFGTYKISLHSGSDKFSVYEIIGSFPEAPVHVKTAGTSYLEALKVMASKVPDFFRSILDFSRDLYQEEKKSYHVSAQLDRVKDANSYSDKELIELFSDDDVRQVLHVTFGRVLTEKDADGNYIFREKLIGYLKEFEETYDQYLYEHFRKHLQPLEGN